jgi:hypothetical protein
MAYWWASCCLYRLNKTAALARVNSPFILYVLRTAVIFVIQWVGNVVPMARKSWGTALKTDYCMIGLCNARPIEVWGGLSPAERWRIKNGIYCFELC